MAVSHGPLSASAAISRVDQGPPSRIPTPSCSPVDLTTSGREAGLLSVLRRAPARWAGTKERLPPDSLCSRPEKGCFRANSSHRHVGASGQDVFLRQDHDLPWPAALEKWDSLAWEPEYLFPGCSPLGSGRGVAVRSQGRFGKEKLPRALLPRENAAGQIRRLEHSVTSRRHPA